jgi:hypothetical protein
MMFESVYGSAWLNCDSLNCKQYRGHFQLNSQIFAIEQINLVRNCEQQHYHFRIKVSQDAKVTRGQKQRLLIFVDDHIDPANCGSWFKSKH